MRRNKRILKLAIYLCVATTSIGLNSAELINEDNLGDVQIIGEAFELNGDKLLYREYHYFDRTGKNHTVLYKNENNELLVDKVLNYQKALTEPNVEQNNYICGEAIRVEQQQDSNSIAISYQADKEGRVKENSLKRPQELVIDAGFNQYLQTHWNDLVNQKSVVFEYLAPSQLKTYPFVAEAVSCEAEGDLQCFTIAPKKWWMKMVLDPILLTYDRNNRLLMSFKGMGNIADKKCDYMEVNIKYQYPSSINPI